MGLKLNTSVHAAAVLLAASPALAGPGHSAAGEPGKATDVSRTVIVTASETDDGRMLFDPDDLRIERGDTIKFVLTNSGAMEHELYLGTHEEVEKHAKQMQKFPEMEHDEPSAVRVDPGHRGEVVWEFTKSGTFTFACLIPGHMESGMVGQISVADGIGFSEGPRATESR